MKHLRHATFALVGALVCAPAAFAQQTADSASGKRFSVVGGYALSEPTRNPQIAGQRTDVHGDGAPTLSTSFHINDNIAIEAWGAVDKFGHRVRTAAGKAGSVSAQPVALSGQYHFGSPDRTVRPFVGLGYHETNFDEERATAGGALAGRRIGVETAKGAIATAGVDLNINPTWFARADVRYLQGNSDVKLDGVQAGEVELEPVVVGVGIGARF